MSNLLVIGAGGHGVVVAEAAELEGRWDSIAFLDDRFDKNTLVESWQVAGSLADAESLLNHWQHCVVAIGDNQRRTAVFEQMTGLGYQAVDVIHPNSCISPRSHTSGGSVFLAGSVVNARARVSQNCIVNTSATVDHDCVVGYGAHISPGAHLAANVHVGALSWLGIGCSVKEGIVIGQNAVVGAGAAVVSNIVDNSLVKGVPAKQPD